MSGSGDLENIDEVVDWTLGFSASAGVSFGVAAFKPAKGFEGFAAFDAAGCETGLLKLANGEVDFGASALAGGASGVPNENNGLGAGSVAVFANGESKMLDGSALD